MTTKIGCVDRVPAMNINRNFPGNIGKLLVVLSAMVAMTTFSHAAGLDNVQKIESVHVEQSTAMPHLAPDLPLGTSATVTPISPRWASGLHDLTLSAFVVDYAPGGSAVLHRSPSSGYVLMYVLSGTIESFAWHARVGTYRAGETWTEPAFAHSIATVNASTRESARALVVVATGDKASWDVVTNK